MYSGFESSSNYFHLHLFPHWFDKFSRHWSPHKSNCWKAIACSLRWCVLYLLIELWFFHKLSSIILVHCTLYIHDHITDFINSQIITVRICELNVTKKCQNIISIDLTIFVIIFKTVCWLIRKIICFVIINEFA